MADTDGSPGRAPRAVSEAMGKTRGDRGWSGSARLLWRWALVDAPRWLVVTILAAGVFGLTMTLGLLGPASVQAFLIEGTSAADAYIEVQTALMTVVTLVLTVNQLILSPEMGPVSRQRQRLSDVVDHREDVEEEAGVPETPTEPAEFLQTAIAAVRQRASRVLDVVSDASEGELRREASRYARELVDEADRVRTALSDEEFGRIGMIGAAMHHDTTQSISQARALLGRFGGSLSQAQETAIRDLLDALETFTVSREYFRVLYIRTEFIKFSRAILYTGIPAFLVAHYAIEIIGPGVLTGTTLGVLDLLWFESAVFTITTVPLLVLAAFVGRLVTLAESSVFVGPFLPTKGNGASPGP